MALLVGVLLVHHGLSFAQGPPQPDPGAARLGTTTPPADPLPASTPLRIRIPEIKVDAPLTRVHRDADGWLEAPPPENANLAGWFTGAVTPGERGTAVIDGHVDNAHGPAVFYGLGALKKGEHIEVDRADGTTAVFEIHGIDVVDKEHFPDRRVYGNTGLPELRVITCGGSYSKRTGYLGNVVLYGLLTSVRHNG
ncbi:class F sortase [Streptomyces sp. GXMU-J5]|uniref:Class F sortase n=1 Tax=Streptomyces beihaiensis TaxID=2984495 RepID=A0ABT3TUY6_9ACTN|nr:class F sortase [Streptomyces beihaiensis]MCX3059890.1 class F sortase [Streptomyces beihaiensis]